MDESRAKVLRMQMERTVKNLEKNNMMAFYVEKKEDVPAKVAELLKEGETISCGGTVTLAECGVLDLMRSGSYNFLDREIYPLGSPEIRELYGKTFLADTYLTSSNAVTEEGELYNVDGSGNRVAAIAYGPKSVIVVAGCNKVVKNLDEAILRVKSISAPANAVRLGRDTYCAHKGECVSIGEGKGTVMCAGCSSDSRICAQYLVCGHQMLKNRIKVILVGEELGY